jgi:hypothetical protein
VRVSEIENEPLAVTDPRDYRRGVLFGSVLVVIGALIGVLRLISDLGILLDRGPSVGASILLGLVFPGTLIVAGLLLVGKGKLGLWLMYCCSALLAYEFGAGVWHDLVSNRRDSVAGIISGVLFWAILLTIWFSIAGYFHNRRKQFTGWWGSDNETKEF